MSKSWENRINRDKSAAIAQIEHPGLELKGLPRPRCQNPHRSALPGIIQRQKKPQTNTNLKNPSVSLKYNPQRGNMGVFSAGPATSESRIPGMLRGCCTATLCQKRRTKAIFFFLFPNRSGSGNKLEFFRAASGGGSTFQGRKSLPGGDRAHYKSHNRCGGYHLFSTLWGGGKEKGF